MECNAPALQAGYASPPPSWAKMAMGGRTSGVRAKVSGDLPETAVCNLRLLSPAVDLCAGTPPWWGGRPSAPDRCASNAGGCARRGQATDHPWGNSTSMGGALPAASEAAGGVTNAWRSRKARCRHNHPPGVRGAPLVDTSLHASADRSGHGNLPRVPAAQDTGNAHIKPEEDH